MHFSGEFFVVHSHRICVGAYIQLGVNGRWKLCSNCSENIWEKESIPEVKEVLSFYFEVFCVDWNHFPTTHF